MTPSRLGLVALAVLGFFLGSPGGPLPILAFLHLIPLALALRGVSPGLGFRLGWLYGTAFFLVTDWWIQIGLHTVMSMHSLAAWAWTGVFCLWHGLPYGVLGWGLGVWERAWNARQPGGPVADIFEGVVRPLVAGAGLAVCVHWFPHLFPGNAAHALYVFPLFLQPADLGGVPLLLFLLGVQSWLVAEMAASMHAARRMVAAACCLLILLVGWAEYGVFRLDEMRTLLRGPDSSSARVLAVQPNIPVVRDGEPLFVQRSHRGILPDQASGDGQRTLIREVVRQTVRGLQTHAGVDLAVWPELPIDLWCDDPYLAGENVNEEGAPRVPVSLRELSHRSRTSILVNCLEQVETHPSVSGEASAGEARAVERVRNVMRLVDANAVQGAGVSGQVYAKQRLVPFGEYLPFGAPDFLRSLFPLNRQYVPGNGPAVFSVARPDSKRHPASGDGQGKGGAEGRSGLAWDRSLRPSAWPAPRHEIRQGGEFRPPDGRRRHVLPDLLPQRPVLHLAAPICYEACFSGIVRGFLEPEPGARLLVNPVDDAWLGNTRASAVHLSMVLPRAVEFRVPMVRVTNSGIGAAIRATGEIVPESLTPLFRKATSVDGLRTLPNYRTVFAVMGNGFVWACSICWLLVLAWAWWRRPSP